MLIAHKSNVGLHVQFSTCGGFCHFFLPHAMSALPDMGNIAAVHINIYINIHVILFGIIYV